MNIFAKSYKLFLFQTNLSQTQLGFEKSFFAHFSGSMFVFKFKNYQAQFKLVIIFL